LIYIVSKLAALHKGQLEPPGLLMSLSTHSLQPIIDLQHLLITKGGFKGNT